MRIGRILPALLLLPLLYFLILDLSVFGFALLAVGVVAIAQYEFYRLHSGNRLGAGLWLGVVLGSSWTGWVGYRGMEDAGPALMLAVGSAALFYLFFSPGLTTALVDSAVSLFGVAYVGWTLSHLVLLRSLADGPYWILFLLLITWTGDAAAFYGGRALGRTPLAPRISPNKTVEGAVLGLAGAVGAAFLGARWMAGKVSPRDALIVGLLLGMAAQLGDLTESMFKRSAGVKDSGALIPGGHGGLLDKLDGLIFAAPVFYYYLVWMKGYARHALVI